MIPRDSCTYTAQYCEENALLLAERLLRTGGETAVVFVSNQIKAVPIWHQRAGNPVVWDYHVLAIHRSGRESPWATYDLDTTLPWGCAASEYVSAAFRPGAVKATHLQQFRVVDAAECIARFSSDRRHMVTPDAKGGSVAYLAPPPGYPPLRGVDARSAHELDSFLDFTSLRGTESTASGGTGAAASESSSSAVGATALRAVTTQESGGISPPPWYGRLLTLADFQLTYAGTRD